MVGATKAGMVVATDGRRCYQDRSESNDTCV